MKRIIALTLALIMALTLGACGGSDAPSGATTTPNGNDITPPPSSTEAVATAPPSSTTGTDAPPQDTGAVEQSPLTLQIIDKRSGIFCLHDPNLKDSYPIPNADFGDYEELYYWLVSFGTTADDMINMTLSMNNMDTTNPTENIKPSQEHLRAVFGMGGAGGDFPLDFQIVGTNIYFKFTLPDSYPTGLDSVGNFRYSIYSLPDSVESKGSVNAVDAIVDSIESGVFGGSTTPGQSQQPDSSVSDPPAVASVDISELTFNADAISLSAKLNGDGTVTYTYTDTSLKPAYSCEGEVFFSIEVSGMDAGTIGITSASFTPYGNDFEPLDLAGMVGDDSAGGEIPVTVDGNGLTATWQCRAFDGTEIENLEAFYIMYTLNVGGQIVFSERVDFGTEVIE